MNENIDKLNKFKPASNDFEFQQYPFYWLMRVGSAYSMRMEKHLKKQGLNITAWRILMILRQMGKLSVTEVATHAVAKTSTITRATYNLQEKELVIISTSKNDGRVSIVELTDKGKVVIASIIENTQKLFDNIYDGFETDQIEGFNSALKKLFVNLEDI